MIPTSSAKAFLSTSVGEERFKSDKRQFAGLMLVLAVCIAFQPLANIATAIGPDGTTVSEGLPLAGLIGGFFLVFVGLTGGFTGYLALVHDYNNKKLTQAVLRIIQLSWVPFITGLVGVGRAASSGVGFIPPEYNPSTSDVRFVGAMGMMGILSYAVAFVGSFAFMAFALFAYQVGKPTDRAAPYFRGRLVFYASLVIIAGLSQLMLGSYVLSNFGSGPLADGPVAVAMYVVTFPELSIVVGLIQLLTGVFGIFRRYDRFNNGKDDHRYQMAVGFMWLCQYSMQIITQIAYLPGGARAGAVPSIACMSLGLNLIPAFLDYKMRTTPNELPANYYGAADSKHELPYVEEEASTDSAAEEDIEAPPEKNVEESVEFVV